MKKWLSLSLCLAALIALTATFDAQENALDTPIGPLSPVETK
ncbi:hypothetical protein [Tumebacillus sp. BK434]|nr:hypothetical protein [Tumebacillus sp. BK434]